MGQIVFSKLGGVFPKRRHSYGYIERSENLSDEVTEGRRSVRGGRGTRWTRGLDREQL